MSRFGKVPREVPVQRSLDLCAPGFARHMRATLEALDGGLVETVFETLRTAERQAFLHGFGRDYDDGRGIVTNAPTNLNSWHGFGLACDVIEKTAGWNAPASFWSALGVAGERHGLAWGGRWKHPDLPHLQWGACPVSPTDADRALLRTQGMAAVWAKYGADV